MLSNSKVKVFAISVAEERAVDDDWGLGSLQAFRRSAQCMPESIELVKDPESADLILFLECRDQGFLADRVRTSKLRCNFKSKVCIVDPSDHYLPDIPGLYASNNRRNTSEYVVTGSYYHTSLYSSLDTYEHLSYVSPKNLYTFRGSCSNHECRRALLDIVDDRMDRVDTSGRVTATFSTGEQSQVQQLQENYFRAIADAKFVICPRGVGAGSIRLFETMSFGRVPVIVSDDWIEPRGMDWNSFSFRVKESQILHLPELLRQEEPRADLMGQKAKEAFLENFSERSMAQYIVTSCLHTLSRWRKASRVERVRPYLKLRDPKMLRMIGRVMRDRLRQ